ncbi:pyruvate kinase [Halocatena halophila]|uniref:pyruvate kinase n=1 Tax=Halocatena halophila TaxID=2814576 RepID=UPI002ED00F8B
MRATSLVCTLGPASNDESTIRALADAGMAVARINTSHGNPQQYRETIENVRAVESRLNRPLSIIFDLQGPEIRTATTEESVELTAGDTLDLSAGTAFSVDEIGLSRPIVDGEAGASVFFDDGRIEGVVESLTADGDELTTTVRITSGGTLGSRKSLVAPALSFAGSVVTERDETALDVGLDAGVDYVAASFVKDAADVMAVAEAIETRGADTPIVAKIERQEAVDSIEGILDVTAAVMVARGDLGVECPIESVPMIQKRLVRQCRQAGIPVIIATEMLDSMISASRPTRAEASDVANAVLDGADAVMLSGETAVGDHPVQVVETMDQIVRSAEREVKGEQHVPKANGTSTDALARSARYLARDAGARAIVVASESGYTARKTAKYRPDVPVIASAPDADVRRQLLLYRGIIPRATEYTTGGAQTIIEGAVETALNTPVVESGDTVVVLSGMMTDLPGTDATNLLKLHVASEVLTTGQCVVAGTVINTVERITDGDLSSIEAGSIVATPESFDGQFTGDLSKIGGIIAEQRGMTGYPAIVARELGVPMISGAAIESLEDQITLDAERGVVYRGEITGYNTDQPDESRP